MLTPELEAAIRSKVNPQYKDTQGTESYERRPFWARLTPNPN